MDKIAIINQPAGLGDILFTTKIRKTLENDGYKVFHPVINEYSWITEYIDGNFPIVNDFKYSDTLQNTNLTPNKIYRDGYEIFLIPLQTADRLFDGSVMDAKYKLMNLNFDDWLDYLIINRNKKKEDELFSLLGIKENDEYIVVNNKFGSPPNFATKDIKINTDCKIIDMGFYDGFTLFDWIKVLEHSKEIHVVESSINYILEKENIDHSKVFIYSKHVPSSFNHVKHLFSKNWNYIF
jgi:hypothetical protein